MSETLDRIDRMITFGFLGNSERGLFREVAAVMCEQAKTIADLTERIEQLESHQRYAAAKVKP